MTEALKCPDCSAPLEYPANAGVSMQCPYCNTTVILPGNSASRAVMPGNFPAAFGPMIGQVVELAEVANALRAGNKIEAIRLYRKIHGADLLTAKNAVERYAAQQIPNTAGQGPNYGTFRPPEGGQAAPYAMRVGCGIAGGTALLVALILLFVFISVSRQMARVQAMKRPVVPPPVFISPPKVVKAPVVVPGFARMTMEFGGEGIGAGMFKDARAIATDNQGHFYVGEYSDGRIQVFDAAGKFISTWSIGTGKSLLALTADRKGMVYAAVPSHIYRFEGATGKAMGEVETMHDDVYEDYSDAFAALDGDLYAIGSNHNIVVIGPDGLVRKIINPSERVGELVSCQRVVVVGTGEIYGLDHSKGIFKFAPDGRYINRFGGGGSGKRLRGHLNWPQNLAVDGKGRIYVSDNGPSILVFDGDGDYLNSFGGGEVVFGLAITDQNEIYACFRNQSSVRKFVLEKP